jgi:molybdate transport system substrate-binding protein
MRVIAVAAVCSAALFGQQAGTLRVLSSNGIRAVVEQTMTQAERAAGKPISIDFGTSSALRQRIDGGEMFDVLLATSDTLEALAAAKKIGPRVDLAQSGIGLGIRSGTAKPDIRTSEALKQTLLKAKSITYAQDGASRAPIERMMQRFGIVEQMRGKTVLEQGSTRATAAVADGKVDIVLTLASEIIPVKGIELVGLLPQEVQNYVMIGAALNEKSANRDAAQAFIRFLSSNSVDAALKANGMERKR